MTDEAGKLDWEAFGRSVLSSWSEGYYSIDAVEIEVLAIKWGLLIPIPGGFDPEVHTDPWGECEPGDDFYQIVSR